MLAQLSQDIINIDSSYFSHSAKLIKAQTICFPCCHIECEAQHSLAPIENPMSETARTKEVKECEKRVNQDMKTREGTENQLNQRDLSCFSLMAMKLNKKM